MCTSGLETLRTPSWSLSRHRCLTPTWSKVHGINRSFNNVDSVLYDSCWFEWNDRAVLQVWMYTAIWWPGRGIWKMWRFSEDGSSTYLTSMLSPGSYLGEFDRLLMCLKRLQIQKQLKALLFSTDVTVSTASVTLAPCIWELKAIQLNSNSVQALLLKGVALRNMGRVQEAIIHFREAMRLAPCRLDCYEGKKDFHDNQNNLFQQLCVFCRFLGRSWYFCAIKDYRFLAYLFAFFDSVCPFFWMFCKD